MDISGSCTTRRLQWSYACLLVYDPELADRVADLIEHDMQPENAWRVDIDANNRLTWTSSEGTVYRQPARNFGQRFADFFYGLLPLEDQL